MKRSIKDKIVVLHYEDAINVKNNTVLFQELRKLHENQSFQRCLGVFISIQDLSYENVALESLVKKLHLLSLKMDIDIAIGDYEARAFTLLKESSAQTCVKLYPSYEAAKLFFTPQSFTKTLSVLLFDEDEKNLDKLASIITKANHTILYARDMEDFAKQSKNNDSISLAISLAKYNIDKTHLQKDNAHQFTLSKKLITHLPTFVDTAVDNLSMITKLKAQKVSHEIMPFNTKIDGQAISAVMSFNGDVQGSFVLIFPKELAIRAVESMLGEKIESIDEASDGIGEFCNIITGGTKTVLSQKQVKVLFDLPKTSTNLDSAKATLKEGSGVWISMKLESQPFYMYISA